MTQLDRHQMREIARALSALEVTARDNPQLRATLGDVATPAEYARRLSMKYAPR